MSRLQEHATQISLLDRGWFNVQVALLPLISLGSALPFRVISMELKNHRRTALCAVRIWLCLAIKEACKALNLLVFCLGRCHSGDGCQVASSVLWRYYRSMMKTC